LLFPLSALGIKKVAFWGHGRNRQRQGRKFAEWLKKSALNRVDWWFAYSEGTARYLIERGVPACKITSVQNAVDTGEFRQQCASISQTEIRAARRQLNIPETASVGLFCGGIFREKLPGFLIESARQIRQRLPDFELLIVGAGPEKEVIEAAARDASYIHFLGPQFGRAKALYFRLADAFLMPGPMGLAILDAFSAGIPVVTSLAPFHGPEIEYLEEGRNGMATPLETGVYTRAVVRLLSDAALLHELKTGSLASSEKYTLEHMVERFALGIARCLNGPVKAAESNQGCIDRSHHGRMGEL
jgi:glycosyltransferase involved in cell wall biosynthesis